MKVNTTRGLGDVVHQRRVDLGWSQARLAQEMGVSRAWVNEFESGKETAQVRLALDALTILGLTIDIRPPTDEPDDE